jgi:hypothetical protein
MDEKVLERADLLIKNKEVVARCFLIEEGMVHLSGASILTMKNRAATEEMIKSAKKLIQEKVSVFSEIRGNAMVPLVCMTAVQEDPGSYVDKALLAYKTLKTEFFFSPYLALASFLMAEETSEDQYAEVTEKAKQIYRLMKKDHPFLTGEQSSPICVIMALSGKDEVALTEDAAACYQILKPSFLSGESVQSLSNVLAMYEGSPEEKCRKTMELFELLKNANMKYGTFYELSTLAPLAMSDMDNGEIVSMMQEADKWLSEQKGFGFFSTVSEKQRHMYAGMLIQSSCSASDALQAMAISSAISIMVMEDTLLYCSICSTIAFSDFSASTTK